MQKGGLIKVTDAKTGKLKRYENTHGEPLAIMSEGKLVFTDLGEWYAMRGKIKIEGNKIVAGERESALPR